MAKVLKWLIRVPAWVWLFVAFSQVVTISARLYELPQLRESIEEHADDPNYANVKLGFQRIYDSKQRQLYIAVAVLPIACALLYWKLSRDKQAASDATPIP